MGWPDPGTAVITGASSGLGAEFARRLAAQGFETILVARRETRLARLARELARETGASSRFVVADLSTPGGVARVVEAIETVPTLDVLVNNAGFGTIGAFHEVPFPRSLAMLHVHVTAPVHLCHTAVPRFLARDRGVIINTCSLAALVWLPHHVMYNATKTFLRAFSESLQLDLAGTPVRVQALCPGYTRTEFHEVGDYKDHFDRASYPEDVWTSAGEVVRASLAAFRARGRDVTVVPGTDNVKVVEGYFRTLARKWRRRAKQAAAPGPDDPAGGGSR